jgi:hypothetical protein
VNSEWWVMDCCEYFTAFAQRGAVERQSDWMST